MRIILTTIATLFLGGLLTAQTAPALETTADEVVVTGARMARPADQSPQRVTVIDSATVARAADLSQLLNEQAGIHINGAWSNPGKDRSVFLRNGANQYTLILVDGQPLLDPSSLGGAVDLRLLDLASVQRIEILRGGASVLYGSDAVAGVINLITKRADVDSSPAPKKPTTHLRAAAGSYNTQEIAATVSGSTGNLDYHGSVSYLRTDGISEALQPDTVATEFDKDGAERFGVDLGLNWRPAAGLSVRPALRLSSFAGDYDAGSFLDAANTYTNDLVNPSLAADYQRGNWTYAARYNFVGTDRVFNAAFPFEGNGRAHQGDLFAVLNPEKGGTLTFGVQLRDEALRLGDSATENPGVTTLSPYAQYTLATTGGFLLDAGARYNQHSEFGGQLNGAFGLGVQTTPTWSTRLNVATAFQSPTIDQLAGPFGPNPELEPQVSTSVELSTRFADPAGGYRLSLTGFVREIDDLVAYVFDADNPFGKYQNQGELRDVGLELEGAAALGKRFRLNGNIAYVNGKQINPDGLGGTTETDQFFRRPRTTGVLGLTYNAYSPFLARLTALYTGGRPDVFFDANFARFETNLDPYFLLNAYAEYKLLTEQNLTVFGELRNLTNTNFVEVTGFATQGATVRVGVGITF